MTEDNLHSSAWGGKIPDKIPDAPPERRQAFILSEAQEILLEGEEYRELREFLKAEGACTDRIWVSKPRIRATGAFSPAFMKAMREEAQARLPKRELPDEELASVYRGYRIGTVVCGDGKCIQRAMPPGYEGCSLAQLADLPFPCLEWSCNAKDELAKRSMFEKLKDLIDLVYLVPSPAPKGSNERWWISAIERARQARNL